MIKRMLFASFIGFLFSFSHFSAKASILPKIRKNIKPNVEQAPVDNIETSSDCHKIIKAIEEKHHIPANLLAAVATIESHKRPWAVNVRGKSRYFATKSDAVHFIQQQKDKGVKNIYVGCMQICLKSHGKKFKDIDHAISPYHNITYAAKLLKQLYNRFGSWEHAVMHYNASSRKVSYTHRVFALWGETPHLLTAANTTQAPSKHIRIAFGPGVGVRSRD